MPPSQIHAMHISFALFADAANLSQEGKLNILGVFDAVQVAAFPTVHPRANLVLRVKGRRSDAGNHSVTLRWLNPEGEELWSSTGELNIGTPPSGVQEMDVPLIASVDLPLDRPGTYTLAIALDDMPKGDLTLQARAGTPPVPSGGMVS
jgi:hypothetical protein